MPKRAMSVAASRRSMSGSPVTTGVEAWSRAEPAGSRPPATTITATSRSVMKPTGAPSSAQRTTPPTFRSRMISATSRTGVWVAAVTTVRVMMSRITIVRRCYPLAAAALPRLLAPDGRTDHARPARGDARDRGRHAHARRRVRLAGGDPDARRRRHQRHRLRAPPGPRRPGRDDQRRARATSPPADRDPRRAARSGSCSTSATTSSSTSSGPLLSALGALFIFVVLAYLFRATRARGGPASAGRADRDRRRRGHLRRRHRARRRHARRRGREPRGRRDERRRARRDRVGRRSSPARSSSCSAR